jgi:hypothetical protein
MNPQLYTQPLSDYNLDGLAGKDGLLEVIPVLDLALDDKYIVQNLNLAINTSQDYYNDTNEFNLKNKRLKNAQMLEGKHLQDHKLYRHQTPYMDNEVFVGIDAILSYVCAQTPRAEVYPASDSEESRVMAKDLENYLHAHSEQFDLPRKLEGAVYNLIGKYVGFLKLRWDPFYGENGEIVPEVVDSNHIIVDKDAKLGENPRFICHVQKDTVEGLCAKFPDKENEILRLFTIKRKGPRNVTAEVAYREVWFTYWDKDHKPQEAVAWYVRDLVLAKYKNPNWLYDEEGENFLPHPMKPFIPFNLTNDGSNWIDKTNALEQAIPQQDILNKLGRQNIDNLATANGFKVLDSHAMRSEDAQNFTGDPNQLLIVKTKPGQTVKDVVLQMNPQLVSEQAILMVQDNRNTIHNILGTPSQFRGDDDDLSKTATTNMMIKDQASGRQDKIVRAVEASLDKYFRLLTQMMTVWYDDKHYATVNGGDGNFDFIEMHKDKIEKGMSVRVQTGTSLPFDKRRQEAVAQAAAQIGIISPYDYYKLMHMDNPQKLYDNFMKWKSDPQSLAMDIANNEADRQAIVDFTELIGGKKPIQREDPTADYIEQLRKLMISDTFLHASKKIQKNVIDFVQQAVLSLAQRTTLENISSQEKAQESQQVPPVQSQGGVLPSTTAPGGFPGGMTPQPGPQPGMPQPMAQPIPQQMPQGIPGPAPIPPIQGSPIQAIMSNRV